VPRPVKLTLNALALALVAALVGLFAWQQLRSGDTVAAVSDSGGQPLAPNFELEKLDGGTVSLAALRGRPVIVNFWATWCRPCKAESGELQRTYERYGPRGLVVLGVDTGDLRSDMAAFARKHDLTYPLLRKGAGVSGRWGITGVPETFFVNRRGRIVAHLSGGVNASDELKRSYDAGLRLLFPDA